MDTVGRSRTPNSGLHLMRYSCKRPRLHHTCLLGIHPAQLHNLSPFYAWHCAKRAIMKLVSIVQAGDNERAPPIQLCLVQILALCQLPSPLARHHRRYQYMNGGEKPKVALPFLRLNLCLPTLCFDCDYDCDCDCD